MLGRFRLKSPCRRQCNTNLNRTRHSSVAKGNAIGGPPGRQSLKPQSRPRSLQKRARPRRVVCDRSRNQPGRARSVAFSDEGSACTITVPGRSSLGPASSLTTWLTAPLRNTVTQGPQEPGRRRKGPRRPEKNLQGREMKPHRQIGHQPLQEQLEPLINPELPAPRPNPDGRPVGITCTKGFAPPGSALAEAPTAGRTWARGDQLLNKSQCHWRDTGVDRPNGTPEREPHRLHTSQVFARVR